MKEIILVTGATGNVGRHVVSDLLGMGMPVRALSRNPDSARLPGGVGVTRGDLLSLPANAMDNVGTVFLVWRNAGAEPASALIEAIAKRARRIVFLSSSAVRDELDRQTNPIAQVHADIERLIEKSGLEWTFLRPGGFAANALSWWAPQIRAGDVVRWPYAAAVGSPIHERDIAAVAVRALTSDGHGGKKYFLTGPQPLSHAEQVRVIGEAIGRSLRFEEISPEAARPQLLARMPAPVVDLLLRVWAGLVNEPAPITSTVADVTGAPAHTFREWAIDHADEFRSAPAASPSHLPEITRPDAAAVLVSEWTVGTPERQQAAIDAFTAAWERTAWPQGLLSMNLFTSTTGETVLSYSQWSTEKDCQEFARTQPLAQGEQARIQYRLYRSSIADPAAPIPGCFVIVSVEFEGPDPQRQRQWVDTVFAALQAETKLPPGGISGHFHLSTDGTRVLNYAQWTDEESHRRALESSGQGTIGKGPLWQRVLNYSGMKSNGFTRYHFRRSLVPAERAQSA